MLHCTCLHKSTFSPKSTSKKGLSSEFSELSAWLAKAHEKQTQFAAGSGDLCAHKGCCFFRNWQRQLHTMILNMDMICRSFWAESGDVSCRNQFAFHRQCLSMLSRLQLEHILLAQYQIHWGANALLKGISTKHGKMPLNRNMSIGESHGQNIIWQFLKQKLWCSIPKSSKISIWISFCESTEWGSHSCWTALSIHCHPSMSPPHELRTGLYYCISRSTS